MGGGIPNKVRCPTPDQVWFRSAPKCEGAESRKLFVRDVGAAVGRRRNQKLKTPDSGYEPSFGTGTRMREYGNVESNDLHICLGWPAHLLSS